MATKIIGKHDLISMVSEKSQMTKKDTELALNSIIEAITESVGKGNEVRIIPFGSFEIRDRQARTGRNPRTGEKIEIPKKKVVAFKAGKALKDAVK